MSNQSNYFDYQTPQLQPNLLDNTAQNVTTQLARTKRFNLRFHKQLVIFLIGVMLIMFVMIGLLINSQFQPSQTNSSLTAEPADPSATISTSPSPTLASATYSASLSLFLSPTVITTRTPTILKNSPTPKPVVTTLPNSAPTPTPAIDLVYDFITMARADGSGYTEQGNNPIIATFQENRLQDIYLTVLVRNNGSQPAIQVTLQVEYQGSTQNLIYSSIPSGGTATQTVTLPSPVGDHSLFIHLNPANNPPESRTDNNPAKSYIIRVLPDSVAPEALLGRVVRSSTEQCFSISGYDNLTSRNELKYELQVDGGAWQQVPAFKDGGGDIPYETCFTRQPGSIIQGRAKVTDLRGNVSPESSLALTF